MIITIENFGVIKHFQFDTEKDLYLLFGKNSMGKSYAISLVYLIFKNIKLLNFEFKIKESSKELDEWGYYKNEMEKTLIELFEKFIKTLSTSLENTFSSIENLQNKFTEKSP
ncbi:AAA family ATPase [Beggiatoa leptomitoformis]|uniref:AAA family ATPase n=1 Tax=Beggiatoa leptomitoformis TaxID=288004 RepID=A0A2N9YF57_9GAMM|nr:AAA family ATPase [Beggiatoa leptomitoformis]ALG68518.1 hypothetical protein AL038_13445 [Beggiatoa leptomitoformis]AUI69141.1 hypothetical protein BLE401_10815 [Beggiatoa leptomitoformis]